MFYANFRESQILAMQKSLKIIRNELGYTSKEFSDFIGVSRQTINNLESLKTSMSANQYIAICALLDLKISEEPDLLVSIKRILIKNSSDSKLFTFIEDNSFVKKWFFSFPIISNNSIVIKQDFFSNNSKGYLDFVNRYSVFVDETILCLKLDENKNSNWSNLLIALEEERKKIISFSKSVQQIKSINKKNNSFDKMFELDNDNSNELSINILMDLLERQLLNVGNSDDLANKYDDIINIFAKYRKSNRIAIITRDEKVVIHIKSLNETEGFPVVCIYCNNQGELIPLES